jgi:uncharacterized protein
VGALDLGTGLAAVLIAAMAGCLSGLSGFGAGLMLSAFLVPILGAKTAVAVLAVTMFVTNAGRALAFQVMPTWRTAGLVLLGAIPAMVPGAWFLARISDVAAALIVGIVLLASLVARRYFKKHGVTAGDGALVAGGAAAGGVSGLSTGGGTLIIPLLMGAGLAGPGLITTDATISLTLNLARSIAYGSFALLDWERLTLGVLLGLATVPGSWLAAAIVKRMPIEIHSLALELLVAIVGIWITARAIAGMV